ncbi:MAG: lysoplasmalogenase family protein [Bacteroidia bacterium]
MFVVSDAVLAFEKFIASFPGARLTVMGTYILAQLALVRGFMSGASPVFKSQN